MLCSSTPLVGGSDRCSEKLLRKSSRNFTGIYLEWSSIFRPLFIDCMNTATSVYYENYFSKYLLNLCLVVKINRIISVWPFYEITSWRRNSSFLVSRSLHHFFFSKNFATLDMTRKAKKIFLLQVLNKNFYFVLIKFFGINEPSKVTSHKNLYTKSFFQSSRLLFSSK